MSIKVYMVIVVEIYIYFMFMIIMNLSGEIYYRVIYGIYFYQEVKSLQILKVSLFIVQKNTSIYLDGINLAQSKENKKVYKKLLEQGENIKQKT